MKLSTNYKLETTVARVSYYSGEESLTIYSTDDEMLEVYGVDFGTVLCFARNLLVVDAERRTFNKHQLESLREIKDALDVFLNTDTTTEAN
jgi:hypothetical protein